MGVCVRAWNMSYRSKSCGVVSHTAAKYKLIYIVIVTSMRGRGRGPRRQRALNAEGGERRRATADRRPRVLLATSCHGENPLFLGGVSFRHTRDFSEASFSEQNK